LVARRASPRPDVVSLQEIANGARDTRTKARGIGKEFVTAYGRMWCLIHETESGEEEEEDVEECPAFERGALPRTEGLGLRAHLFEEAEAAALHLALGRKQRRLVHLHMRTLSGRDSVHIGHDTVHMDTTADTTRYIRADRYFQRTRHGTYRGHDTVTQNRWWT